MARLLERFRSGAWKLAAALVVSILLHVFAGLYAVPGSSGSDPGALARPVAWVRLPTAASQRQGNGWQVVPGKPSPAPAVSDRTDSSNGTGEIFPGGSPVRYMDTQDLTAQAYPLEDVDVAFPPGIVPQDGRLVVELLIEPDGRAARVTPIQSELPEEYSRQVVQTFVSKRYAPGKIHERAVPSRLLVEVVFDTSGLF